MSDDSQGRSAGYEARAVTTPGGCGYVELWKKDDDQTGSLVWKFMPQKNNPPLILTRVIGETILVTVDEAARAGIFEIAGRNQTTSKEFKSCIPAGASLDQTESLLLIALQQKPESHRCLLVIDIKTLEIKNRVQLPDHILLTSLQVINEDEVIFYFPGGNLNDSSGRDGLLRVNFKYNTRLPQYFSNSPAGRLSMPPMAVCPEKNVGIRPCYEKIEISTSLAENRYLAKAILFELDTCRTIRRITLREFRPDQVFEDDDPEIALSYLELPAASEEQIEARDEFLERIDAFIFSPAGDAFWVGFQHGTIRKMSLEGEYLSPLIAHPGDPTCSSDNPFHPTGFDNPISISDDNRTITFGIPPVTCDLSKIEVQSDSDLTLLTSTQILQPPTAAGPEAEKEFSWNTVEMANPEDEASYRIALEQLVHLTENIDKIRDGNLVRFQFHSRQGDLTEKEFYSIAFKINRCQPLMSRLVQNLCDCEAPFWYDTQLPAGFYAIQPLVLEDDEQLKLLVKYLGSVVDRKYAGNDIGGLVDDVIHRHGWNRATLGVLLAFAENQPEPGLDLLQKRLKSQGFLKFTATPENRSYFRNHRRFKSLLEDYFQLLLPGEDSLFEAIEAEDENWVREILKDEVDLNIIHPDFNCTPLELAFELENRDLLRLLIEKGADIERLNIEDLAKTFLQGRPPSSAEEAGHINRTIESLNRRKENIQDQISKIEYRNMLSFTVSSDQLAELNSLKDKLEALHQEIRFARLGLDKTGRNPLTPLPAPENTGESTGFHSGTSREFIGESGYFEEDLKAATVVVRNLDDESELSQAFEQLIAMSGKLDELVVDDRLRFSFKDSQRILNEKRFFESLELTPQMAEKLSAFLTNVIHNAPGELWYDDDTQACIYPLQSLVLFDRQYIKLFIRYLKSGISNPDHEKQYPTELVFDVIDQYGWCKDTLELLAVRTIVCGSSYAMDELRIQLKKGGLKEYLQDSGKFDTFVQYLQAESGEMASEEIDTICDMIRRLSNP